MIFKVKFLWSDPGFIKPRYEWLPIEAKDRYEAVAIFMRFLGTKYSYPILDVSILDYSD